LRYDPKLFYPERSLKRCDHGMPIQTIEEQVSAPKLLVVEDEAEAARQIALGLEAVGWAVEIAGDGETGLERAATDAFDVIIVDRMLPRRSGLSLVQTLRARGRQTPVLFVTAMGAVTDRVAGLEEGGDDYLVKPYSMAELTARVNALARRSAGPLRERTVLRVDDLVLNRLERSVRRGEREIELLPLEFKLLEFLLLHAGQIVTRTMLLERVWGFHFDPRTNIVETHISRLRSKLDSEGSAPLICTVRGAGYVVGAL
jgi:two-component system, OmpR family, response regulator